MPNASANQTFLLHKAKCKAYHGALGGPVRLCLQ